MVMWALFYSDRQATCLSGLPMAIDDRFYMDNFPIDTEVFQGDNQLVSLRASTHAKNVREVPVKSIMQPRVNDLKVRCMFCGRLYSFERGRY